MQDCKIDVNPLVVQIKIWEIGNAARSVYDRELSPSTWLSTQLSKLDIYPFLMSFDVNQQESRTVNISPWDSPTQKDLLPAAEMASSGK